MIKLLRNTSVHLTSSLFFRVIYFNEHSMIQRAFHMHRPKYFLIAQNYGLNLNANTPSMMRLTYFCVRCYQSSDISLSDIIKR
jgi:hypothetical protein